MSEHKIGEQWVEKGSDGKMHMYKAVENTKEKCGACAKGCDCDLCSGCDGSECPNNPIIKDLGVLNEDGCLPEERTGEYPVAKKVINLDLLAWVWWVGIDRKADINGAKLSIGVEALTKEQAIDAWNRRA